MDQLQNGQARRLSMKTMKRVLLCTTLLVSLLGGTIVQANGVTMNTPTFSDVPTDHWAQPAILWGVQQKITSGYEDGTFKPKKDVTEEEFIKMLVRAYGIETSTEIKQRWSDPFYSVAADYNLPVTDSRTASITRQSVANIIVGTQGVNFMDGDAVQYMLAKGLTKGKTAATIEGYKGQDTLTRAEAITFIKNVMDEVENKTMQVRPKELSSRALLDPTSESRSKPIITMDNYIRSFNESLSIFGISDIYKIDTTEIDTRVTSDFTSHYYAEWDYIPNAYILNAVADADTGLTVSFTIYGDLAKGIAANAIATFVQDVELGGELLEEAGIIKAIDQANLTGDHERIIFSSKGYDIRYRYDKEIHTHMVSINQVPEA